MNENPALSRSVVTAERERELRVAVANALDGAFGTAVPARSVVRAACLSVLSPSLPCRCQPPADRVSEVQPCDFTFEFDRAGADEVAGSRPGPLVLAASKPEIVSQFLRSAPSRNVSSCSVGWAGCSSCCAG